MKSLMMWAVGLRSYGYGINLDDFSHTRLVLHAMLGMKKANIRIHKTVQLLVQLCVRIVIHEFAGIAYPSLNCGGHLHYSYG